MLGTRLGMTSQRLRPLVAGTLICALALAASAATAGAQTYGFATLQPGTLNHTTASAIAKVLKEKAGLNVLVQPTAGDQVIVPMIARDEAEIPRDYFREPDRGAAADGNEAVGTARGRDAHLSHWLGDVQSRLRM